MYRQIIEDLKKWKDNKRRKPLILTGVRQCGKTYTVTEFGNKFFNDMVYINLETNAQYRSIFEYDFDVKRIVSEIACNVNKKIIPGETLLFIDEIQESESAITSMKYFCENMRELHVICAGSLLGVALKRSSHSFPVGKVNRMQLYPMNFKEFILANGKSNLIEILQNRLTDRPIPDLYADPLKKLLTQYYIVGGMPDVVMEWLETGSFESVEAVQREILNDYSDDFAKHAPLSDVPKIRMIWDSVPVQLAKENNKFVFSHVKSGKRAADLEDSLRWLVDAGLISQVFMVENASVPLSAYSDITHFKVYMSDVGLLRVKSGLSYRILLDGNDGFREYKGALVENYVYNELKSLGLDPYFWRSGNTAELDFLFEKDGYITPVEVKSADNTKAKSYTQFCKRYKPIKGFKLSQKNLAVNFTDGTQTVSLPLYLTWNILSMRT